MQSEKISTQPKHTGATFSLASSLALHKMAFYGWRSLLLFTVISSAGLPNYAELDNLKFWLPFVLGVALLVGGLLGDLLLGNKRTATIGTALMCVGSLFYFLGMDLPAQLPYFIFAAGCGLHQSNLKALYAKLYLHDTRLLDAGFQILYLLANIAAFCAVILLNFIAEKYGFEYGFLTVSILSLGSAATLFITPQAPRSEESTPAEKGLIHLHQLKALGLVLGIFILYAVFQQLSQDEITREYVDRSLFLFYGSLDYYLPLDAVLYLLLSILLIVLWSRKYFAPIRKITLSALLLLIAFGLSYLSYSISPLARPYISVIAMIMIPLAELLIEPFIDTSIAMVVRQKYLAIAYGTSVLLTFFAAELLMLIHRWTYAITENTLEIGLLGLLLLSIYLVIRRYRSI
jgi:POT family proton-dependent oligopeptide transporter